MEPLSVYREVTKAKLIINTVGSSKLYQQEPFVQRPPEEQPKDYFKRFAHENVVSPTKTWKSFANPQQNNLPIPVKEQIFKQPMKDRPIYMEVAQVLGEICDAVAQGHPYGNQNQSPIINRVIEEKMKNQEREQKEYYEAEKRRKIHMQHLKEKLKAHGLQKPEEEKKAKQDGQPKQPATNEKKQVDWKRYYEEQLEKLKNSKEKNKDKNFIQERDAELKQKEQEAKKKQFQEFNAKRIAEIVIHLYVSRRIINLSSF